MNKYFFICSFWAITIHGQITFIPDANFEQALIDLGVDADGLINGQVWTQDIESVEELEVADRGILDLSGLQDFVSLQKLDCTGNDLSFLDVSSNRQLKILRLSGPKIKAIDLDKNTQLESLEIHHTSIDSINLEKNLTIKTLEFRFNSNLQVLLLGENGALEVMMIQECSHMQRLDMTGCPNLKNLFFGDRECLIDEFDLSGNISLEKLSVHGLFLSKIDLSHNVNLKELYCSNNSFDTLDLSNNTELIRVDCSDHNFDHGFFNRLRVLDFGHNKKIEEIACSGVQLEVIHLDSCASLKSLDVSVNPLKSLNISGNERLERLFAGNSHLSVIDISKNTKLEVAYLSNGRLGREILPHKNQLEELNVGHNIELQQLDVQDNEKLMTVDVRNGNNEILNVNASGCHLLKCIFVDDKNGDHSTWTLESSVHIVETEEECERRTSVAFETPKMSKWFPNPADQWIGVTDPSNMGKFIELHSLSGGTYRCPVQWGGVVDVSRLPNGVYASKRYIKGHQYRYVEKVVIHHSCGN